MTHLTPHHDGSPLYVSNLAPGLGDTVRVRVRIPHGYGPLVAVRTRSNPDHEPAWTDAERMGAADGWDWWEADIIVANPRHGYRWVLQHEDGAVHWLNQSGLHTIETLDAEDFALVTSSPPPRWLNDAVLYQVFPDRFARSATADTRPTPDWAIPANWRDPVDPVMPARSQQFYGGDLDGVTEKLDHLVALGVNLRCVARGRGSGPQLRAAAMTAWRPSASSGRSARRRPRRPTRGSSCDACTRPA